MALTKLQAQLVDNTTALTVTSVTSSNATNGYDAYNASRVSRSFGWGLDASGNYGIWDTTSSVNNRLIIDSSGNLGLGITPSSWGSPRRALQVGGHGSISGNATGNGFFFVNNNTYIDSSSNSIYINTAAASRFDLASDGSFRWNQASSGTAGTTISFTQAMTLDTSGNLLVGVTTQYSGWKIQVNNNNGIAIQNAAGTGHAAWFGAASSAGMASSGDYAILSGSSGIIFASGATEKARLDANGRLLVGLSSGGALGRINSYAADGSYGLVLQSGTYGLRALSDTGNSGFSIQAVDGTGGVSYQPLLLGGGGVRFFTGTAGGGSQSEAARFDNLGNLGIGTATPTSKLHLYSNVFNFIYAYAISDYRGVCDGSTGGYLLVIPAYPGSGTVSGKKFYGTIVADRGSTGEGNSTNVAYIHASTAYNSGTFLVQTSVSNQYFASTHLLTYSGTQYYALRFTSTGGGPSGGIYISGAHRGLDSNCFTLKLDSEVSNVLSFGTRTVLFP